MGVGIDDLHSIFAKIVSRRTLQRRLGELAKQQKIATLAKGRGLRYRQPRIIKANITEPIHLADEVGAEVTIPVSPAGQEALHYVRQPIQGRKPVGYAVHSWKRIAQTKQSTSQRKSAATCTTSGGPPTENAKRAHMRAISWDACLLTCPGHRAGSKATLTPAKTRKT